MTHLHIGPPERAVAQVWNHVDRKAAGYAVSTTVRVFVPTLVLRESTPRYEKGLRFPEHLAW